MALFPGQPRWAGTRKVKAVWILVKQETVSGSGISWAICKSAPCCRQTTTPAPHHSVFYRPDVLPAAQPTASKHWNITSWLIQYISNQLLIKDVNCVRIYYMIWQPLLSCYQFCTSLCSTLCVLLCSTFATATWILYTRRGVCFCERHDSRISCAWSYWLQGL